MNDEKNNNSGLHFDEKNIPGNSIKIKLIMNIHFVAMQIILASGIRESHRGPNLANMVLDRYLLRFCS